MEQNRIDQTIRLKKLIKALSLNQLSFANSLGMAQPNISRMVSGEGRVSVEVLNRISDTYKQVNLHWLLTGVGEMFLEELTDQNPQVNERNVMYNKKGKLEELEERLDRLEEAVKALRKKGGK